MGRPTAMTPETLMRLDEAFSFGCTDLEACHFAGIGKTALYSYQKANPEYTERKEALKDKTVLLAKKNVQDAILDGDKDMTKWLLERKRRDEYSTKQNHDHTSAGEPITEINVNYVKAKATDTTEV